MLKLYVKVQSYLKSEEGQGMVEYAMIIGLVAIGVLALLTLMGGQIGSIFCKITETLKNANPTTTTPATGG